MRQDSLGVHIIMWCACEIVAGTLAGLGDCGTWVGRACISKQAASRVSMCVCHLHSNCCVLFLHSVCLGAATMGLQPSGLLPHVACYAAGAGTPSMGC